MSLSIYRTLIIKIGLIIFGTSFAIYGYLQEEKKDVIEYKSKTYTRYKFNKINYEDIENIILEKSKTYKRVSKNNRTEISLSNDQKKMLLNLLKSSNGFYSRPTSQSDRYFYLEITLKSGLTWYIEMYVRDNNGMFIMLGEENFKSKEVFKWLINNNYMEKGLYDEI